MGQVNLVDPKHCTKPCKTCPFLKENHGRPNPEGWVGDAAQGKHDWYSPENLRRLWADGLRNGNLMICHATDPNSPNYGSTSKPKAGNERVCLGALAMIRKSLNYLEQHDFNWYTYRRVTKYPATKKAWGAIISQITFNVSGAAIMEPLLDETTGVPWDDKLLNSANGLGL